MLFPVNADLAPIDRWHVPAVEHQDAIASIRPTEFVTKMKMCVSDASDWCVSSLICPLWSKAEANVGF
jgi:hypothetical protein